jgi:uncharacterized protein
MTSIATFFQQCSERGSAITSSIRLSELHIYPIKSARGIAVPSARVERRGLEHDRRWMVVDEQGNFLTQRFIPRMALIRVKLTSQDLIVESEGMNKLSLPLKPSDGESVHVRVWDDSFDAMDTGPQAAAWFTELLSRPCRLVFMPDQTERLVNPKYSAQKTIVSFADAFPFMLISQASLDELNSRLAESVPMNRFRPNIVLDGCKAYDEDTWTAVRIGSMNFRVAKPCSRCTVPTVNQETGIRASEPILTLSTYRTVDNKVYFGQNLTHEAQGILTVGDEVHATLP